MVLLLTTTIDKVNNCATNISRRKINAYICRKDMNTKEHKAYLADFKKFAKEVTATKEAAQAFLVSAGILTKEGKLTPPYSSIPE